MTKQAIIERAAPIINEFKSLWERWRFEIEPLRESTPLDFTWAIKWRGALVRPLQIYIWERQDKQSKSYRIHLISDEKVDYTEVTDDDDLQGWNDKQRKNWRHYFRKSLERLTEYLVLAAARAQATDEAKIHIRKSGKPLYIDISNHRYALLFRVGKTTWTWTIKKWETTPPFGWVKVDSIRRRHEENPVQILSRIVKGLCLSAL